MSVNEDEIKVEYCETFDSDPLYDNGELLENNLGLHSTVVVGLKNINKVSSQCLLRRIQLQFTEKIQFKVMILLRTVLDSTF